MNKISIDELKAKMEANEIFTLVDLRDKQLYEHNHIPSAMNVPYVNDFKGDAEGILHDKDAEIIAYADDESSSEGACATFNEMGYRNLKCLDGGIRGWMEKGYQLEFGEES